MWRRIVFFKNRKNVQQNSFIMKATAVQPSSKFIDTIKPILDMTTILITAKQPSWYPKKLKVLKQKNQELTNEIIKTKNSISILKLAYQHDCIWHTPIVLPKRVYNLYELQEISAKAQIFKKICTVLGVGGLLYTGYSSYLAYMKKPTNITITTKRFLLRRYLPLTSSTLVLMIALLASRAERAQKGQELFNEVNQKTYKLSQNLEYYRIKKKAYISAYQQSWKFPSFFSKYYNEVSNILIQEREHKKNTGQEQNSQHISKEEMNITNNV